MAWFIAINDNYDTIDPNSVDNDFAGIKTGSTFYARDTSRKIRAVNRPKGAGAADNEYPPTATRKTRHPERAGLWTRKRHRWSSPYLHPLHGGRGAADRQGADGRGYSPPRPTSSGRAARPQQGGGRPGYHWNTNTVVHILERREYTGCTVNFPRPTPNSIWDKKQRHSPEDRQAIFYNTHPAIIEAEVFDKVQEIRQRRHQRRKRQEQYILRPCLSRRLRGENVTAPRIILRGGKTTSGAPTTGATLELFSTTSSGRWQLEESGMAYCWRRWIPLRERYEAHFWAVMEWNA